MVAMRDFKFIRTKALAPKFEEPTIKELIRCVADNMDDAQWRQYQSLSAEEQEVYAFALLTETEETVNLRVYQREPAIQELRLFQAKFRPKRY